MADAEAGDAEADGSGDMLPPRGTIDGAADRVAVCVGDTALPVNTPPVHDDANTISPGPPATPGRHAVPRATCCSADSDRPP